MGRFISYAQNFEDVLLWRALRDVNSGYYIDVGAHDPVIDSVTKAFSERGWRGINIEPVQYWHERLVSDRPADINLSLAASSQNGTIRFYEVSGTGLSTVKKTIARQHEANGSEINEYDVPTRRLDDICFANGVEEVHFLKIDVEGNEAEVLKGIDLTRIRPWIIVVESTEPLTQVTTHHVWEQLLTTQKYKFVYFDGLNRFYLAEERSNLSQAFTTPPNVFDDFIQYPHWLANANVNKLEVALADANNRLNNIYTSLPWRLTKPLRLIRNLYNKLSH